MTFGDGVSLQKMAYISFAGFQPGATIWAEPMALFPSLLSHRTMFCALRAFFAHSVVNFFLIAFEFLLKGI